MTWDRWVLDVVVEHRSDLLTAVARGVMAAGQPVEAYAAAAAAGAVVAWSMRAWWALAGTVVSTVLATTLAELAKLEIARPRPPAMSALVPADGFAMPSSIAALTAGAATPMVLFAVRRATAASRALATALVAGTALAGLSMVYLGAHWASDVVAGWALGTAVGVAVHLVLRRVSGRGVPGRRSGTALTQ